jgi:hypothetical protein
MRRYRPHLIVVLLPAMLLLAAAGCAKPAFEYRPDGGSMTFLQAEDLGRTADISGVADIAVEDAPAKRAEVLAGLRANGDEGKRAADLLTEGFPVPTVAVPVLVTLADVDGVRSLIAVEAYKGTGDRLTRRRLWVFDFKTGAIVRSVTYR